MITPSSPVRWCSRPVAGNCRVQKDWKYLESCSTSQHTQEDHDVHLEPAKNTAGRTNHSRGSDLQQANRAFYLDVVACGPATLVGHLIRVQSPMRVPANDNPRPAASHE